MANAIHTSEWQTTQTKEFDFVFVEEAALPQARPSYKSAPPPTPATPSSSFEPASLHHFHEEFKSLVLDSNQAYLEREQLGWEQLSLQEPIEPHEIEWLNWAVPDTLTAPTQAFAPRSPNPSGAQLSPQAAAPQQTIKPIIGPRLGTPPPIEIWVVKTIGVLVALNVLFASLIVSGTRLNDWLK